MELFDRELDIGDDRFETPRTNHSATKSHRSKQSITPRSSNSDEYKTVSSRSSAFHNDNADFQSANGSINGDYRRPSTRSGHNDMADFHSANGSVNGDYRSANGSISGDYRRPIGRPPRKDSVSDGSVYNDTDVTDIFSYARHGRCDDIIRSLSRGIPVDIRDDVGNTMVRVLFFLDFFSFIHYSLFLLFRCL